MNDTDLERQLAQAAGPLPPRQARAALLARAEERLRKRARRGRQFRWAVAATAVLLVAVNLGFEAHHSRRLTALLGPAPAASVVAASPEAWREQQQMMAEILGDTTPPERRPSYGHGPISEIASPTALAG